MSFRPNFTPLRLAITHADTLVGLGTGGTLGVPSGQRNGGEEAIQNAGPSPPMVRHKRSTTPRVVLITQLGLAHEAAESGRSFAIETNDQRTEECGRGAQISCL